MPKSNRDINKDITPAEKANIESSIPVAEAASFGGDPLPEFEAPSATDRGDLSEVATPEPKAEDPAPAPEPKAEDPAPAAKPSLGDDPAPKAEEPKAEDPAPAAEPKAEKPKSRAQERIQKEVNRRKEAEARVRELEAQQKDNPAPAAKEPEEPKALWTDDEFKAASESQLDGNYAPMQELMQRSITAAAADARKGALDEARQIAAQEVATADTNKSLRAVADEIATEYPELDSTSDQSDAGMIDETIGLRDFYVQRGSSHADALREAALTVAHKYGLGAEEAPAAVSDTNALADGINKKKPDIQAKIDIAAKEKGKLGGDGAKNRDTDYTANDLLALGEDQFEKVSAEVLARARGDIA